MKTLIVMRHAKSTWKQTELADHDRPLNKRGKKDAPRMGAVLRHQKLVPDLILCSSAVRAQATAAAVAAAVGYQGEIRPMRTLYAAGPKAYVEALRALPDLHERVLVIGHNPGLEQLLEALTGEATSMPTAAIARVALPIEHWSAMSEAAGAELLSVWRPKESG